MPRRRAIAAATLAAALLPGAVPRRPASAQPEAGTGPIVLELFTSQSCSSCPPADALLAEMARSGDGALLPLAFHVTYWDRLGWKDRFSLPAATQRQRRYAALWGRDNIYTPQLVVQGERDAVGSDRQAVREAIAAARRAASSGPRIALAPAGTSVGGLTLTVSAGRGSGAIVLVGFDPRHVTPVRGGENAGRTLVQTQVVRGIAETGIPWRGEALSLAVARPSGARVAALLQAADGRILAASVLPGTPGDGATAGG